MDKAKHITLVLVAVVLSTSLIIPSADADVPDHTEGRFFYDQLTAEEKRYYNDLSKASVGQKLSYHRFDSSAFKNALYAYEAEASCTILNAGARCMIYTYTDGSGYVMIESRSGDDIPSNVVRLKEAVESFDFTGIDNDYEAIVAINDYLVERITYNHGWAEINGTDAKDVDHGQDSYGALVHEKQSVVCEGYAEAFKALCDSYGIECYEIGGRTLQDGTLVHHAWNIVRMDDGKWYPVDVTWNDNDDESIGDHDYLLCSSAYIGRNHAMGYEYTDFEYPELSETGYYVESQPEYTDISDSDLLMVFIILGIMGVMVIAEIIGLYHLVAGTWRFISSRILRRRKA